MDGSADLHDWELVHGSDFTDNYYMGVVVPDEDSSNVAIKDDYFAFDPSSIQHLQSEESDEGGIDSDNPSCADPDSDSNAFFETSKEHLGIAGMTFQIRSSGGFVSDEASDGQRSLANSEHVELGSLESSAMEMGSEESDPGRGNLGGDGEGSDRSDSREMTEIGGDAGINEGEKREKTWWKVPLGLLKYCLVGMRPVWSISIAAAVVGLVMLWRKLYRMKQKNRSIPLRLTIDEKVKQVLIPFCL